jgi:hypothetical protein
MEQGRSTNINCLNSPTQNKGETESTIVADEDQAISTDYFKNKFLKDETDIKCRLCKQHEETLLTTQF